MDKEELEDIITRTIEYYFEGLTFKEAINKALEEGWKYGNNLCIQRKMEWRYKEKRFDSYESLGKWVADNATEIINIDCIQEED